MIPKIIHFCWLSDDDYPSLIKKCISSWQKKLPDYEFILWDTNRFKLESNLWVKQAFYAKKYAFAADYIRLHAVYNYGGIYLDTDIEVLKSFNDLLHLPYFIGSEGDKIIEAGVFGAEKKCEWIKDCLNYYDNRSFIKTDGSLNTLTLPRIMMSQISKNRKTIEIPFENIEKMKDKYSNDNLIMMTQDIFCAKNQGTGLVKTSKNTYSIHHFAMSWIPKKHLFIPNLKRKLIKIFSERIILYIINVFNLRALRKIFTKKNN